MISRDITLRSIVESDVDAILPLLRRDPASPLSAQDYQDKLADRQYRFEWTWIAQDDATGEILAVIVYWGGPNDADGSGPHSIDGILAAPSLGTGEERIAVVTSLLTAAHEHFKSVLHAENVPDYHVFIPGDWRDQPDVVEALEWRQEAVERAGLTDLLERLRYRWTPEAGVPAGRGRLTFRPEGDDEVFVDLFTRVLEGSLDTSSTKEAATMGAAAQAREDVEFYRDVMLGERDWWRVAVNGDGEVVGFGFPSRNPNAAVVGYLGVLPEYRGHGHVDEILAEITRQAAEELGMTQLSADTDLVNQPMAASFERAGYVNVARRLVFSAS